MRRRAPILTAPAFLLRFRKMVLSNVPVFEWGDLRAFFAARTSIRSARRLSAIEGTFRKRGEFEVADL